MTRDLPTPIDVGQEHFDPELARWLENRRYMKARELADVAAREEALRLCPECRAGEHRNPPNGSVTCRCEERTCNCIATPPTFARESQQ